MKMIEDNMNNDKTMEDNLNHDKMIEDNLNHDKMIEDNLNHDKMIEDNMNHDKMIGDNLKHEKMIEDDLNHDKTMQDNLKHEKMIQDDLTHDKTMQDNLKHEVILEDDLNHDQTMEDDLFYGQKPHWNAGNLHNDKSSRKKSMESQFEVNKVHESPLGIKLGFYTCTFCDFKTKMATTLVKHMEKDHHEKKMHCKLCVQDFETSLFLDHTRSVHNKFIKKKGIYPCTECGKVFYEKYRLGAHKDVFHHIEVSVCEFCSTECKNKEMLQRHIYAVHKKHESAVCDQCSKVFKSKIYLYRHKYAVHEGKEELVCYNCGKKVMNEYKLKRHLKRCCKTKVRKEKEKRTVFCRTCNGKFWTLDELMVHNEKVHTPVSCQVCRKEFSCMQKFRMTQHVERCNIRLNDEPPLTCPFCQKELTNVGGFQTHLKRMHKIHDPNHLLALVKEVKPDFDEYKTCEQCDFRTKYGNNLKKHIMSVHEGNKSIWGVKKENGGSSLENTNDSSKENNSQDPTNLSEHQIKRKALVEEWKKMEKEQNEKKRNLESGQTEHSNGKRSLTQESVQDYNPDLCDESPEDFKLDLIPKCEDVKLEADESANESEELNVELEELNAELEELNDSMDGLRCNECGKSFSQIKSLIEHVKLKHTYEPCPCPFCGFQLKNQTYLAQHLKKFHKDDINEKEIKEIVEEIKTEVKSTSIKTEVDVDVQTGEVKDEVKYKCKFCDHQVKRKDSLYRHVQVVHKGVKYQCELCDYSATSKSNLNTHVKAVHEGVKYDCEHCEHKATTNGNLNLHIKTVHSGMKMDEIKEGLPDSVPEGTTCDECDKIFKHKYNLKQHKKRFHSEFKREKRSKKGRPSKIKMEGELPEIDLLCHLCGTNFETKQQMKSHVKIEHPAEGLSKEGRQCPHCPGIFKSLHNHIYMIHTDHEEAFCSQCGKGFKNKKLLENHMRDVHPTEDRKRVCPICAKEFPNPAGLNNHLTRSNICGEVDKANCVFCDECGKEFRDENRLKRHQKRSIKCCPMDPENCVNCEKCGKAFPNKYLLEYHIKWVHPSEDQIRVCQICYKEFGSEVILRTHQRQSNCQVDNSNCVKCPECGKEFVNKYRLHAHQMDQHFVENVNCPICGGIFKNRTALGKHIKKSHDGQVKNPYTKKTMSSSPEEGPRGGVVQPSMARNLHSLAPSHPINPPHHVAPHLDKPLNMSSYQEARGTGGQMVEDSPYTPPTPPTHPFTPPGWTHHWPNPFGHPLWQHPFAQPRPGQVKEEFTERQT